METETPILENYELGSEDQDVELDGDFEEEDEEEPDEEDDDIA